MIGFFLSEHLICYLNVVVVHSFSQLYGIPNYLFYECQQTESTVYMEKQKTPNCQHHIEREQS